MSAGTTRLTAGDGLSATISASGQARIAWSERDWLGPGRVTVDRRTVDTTVERTLRGRDDIGAFRQAELHVERQPLEFSVRAYTDQALLVFETTAIHALTEFATGTFAEPRVSWPHWMPVQRARGGAPSNLRGAGFQYTEFAWPTDAAGDLARWSLLPFRPPIVLPMMLIAPDDRTLLIGPLDHFHDQVIVVAADGNPDAGVRCGWHGDLDEIPAGYITRLGLLAASSPRAALDEYGRLLRVEHATVRRGRYADALGSRPSYWTDNGSAYWYRTESPSDTEATLVATLDDLRARDIPVDAVQLDSWWYPHEVLRPFDTDEWIVPPTGLVTWEPRLDVLPSGLAPLRDGLGHPPLVLHCRHVSAQSPYTQQFPMWLDGDRAHPSTPALYERWLDQAQAWGAQTFEHDWLVESFLGVRELRRVPGRARAWQEGIDAAADRRGLTLQWCMATPADFLQSVTLRALTSIRTSSDSGYLIGPGMLWTWFLMVNALARVLDLVPYKDVMHADVDDPDAHAELEALLAALSAGPVGIGDRVGRASREIVMRTCRADGVLVKPDAPIAAIDRCFREWALGRARPIIAETFSDQPAGRWTYLVALNPASEGETLSSSIRTAELGAAAPPGSVLAWDWRARTPRPRTDEWTALLDPLGWEYTVLTPLLLDGRLAVLGDAARYTCAGDRRLVIEEGDHAVHCTVLGAPGEPVTLTGWSALCPDVAVTGRAEPTFSFDTGVWAIDVEIGASGWTSVELRLR